MLEHLQHSAINRLERREFLVINFEPLSSTGLKPEVIRFCWA